MATRIRNVKVLYKFLMRETEKLPSDASKFYQKQIRAVSSPYTIVLMNKRINIIPYTYVCPKYTKKAAYLHCISIFKKIKCNTDNFVKFCFPILTVHFLTFHYFLNFQGYQQHAEEDDQERIKQIIQRSVEDADWIVKKVKLWSNLPQHMLNRLALVSRFALMYSALHFII